MTDPPTPPPGANRETYTTPDGRTWVALTSDVTLLPGGWVRFLDAIPGCFVDARARRRGDSWTLTGLRIEVRDGFAVDAITGTALRGVRPSDLAKRAGGWQTLNVPAIRRRTRQDAELTDRRATIRTLLAQTLDRGGKRADVARAIEDRYGITRATAWRWIKDAEGNQS